MVTYTVQRITAKVVTRGLDPRVHRFFAITLSRPCPAKGMDARDKPVHDNLMRLAQVENARRSVPATQVRAVRGVGKWVA